MGHSLPRVNNFCLLRVLPHPPWEGFCWIMFLLIQGLQGHSKTLSGISGAFRAFQCLQGHLKSLPGLLSEVWEVHMWQRYPPNDPRWSCWPKACLGLVHKIVRFFVWLFCPNLIPQCLSNSISLLFCSLHHLRLTVTILSIWDYLGPSQPILDHLTATWTISLHVRTPQSTQANF